MVKKRRKTKAVYSPRHSKASGLELEERKLALDDESRLSNRTPSPLNEDKPPSPGEMKCGGHVCNSTSVDAVPVDISTCTKCVCNAMLGCFCSESGLTCMELYTVIMYPCTHIL